MFPLGRYDVAPPRLIRFEMESGLLRKDRIEALKGLQADATLDKVGLKELLARNADARRQA